MLALGAAWLVEGASRLALRLGVTPMVVGLTVIGFGTSLPEFSVSVLAVARGSGGLGLPREAFVYQTDAKFRAIGKFSGVSDPSTFRTVVKLRGDRHLSRLHSTP